MGWLDGITDSMDMSLSKLQETDGKESACQYRRCKRLEFDPWVRNIPWSRKWLFSSVQFSCSVVSDSLRPHGLQPPRLPCPSPTPGVCSNSYPSSRLCHPIISASVVPFSFCLQSFPASGSFQMSQFFASGGQRIEVSASASVLPMNIQD